MREVTVFFESYSQIVVPVSAIVLLCILYGAPLFGMATFLNKKAVPLLLKRHKTRKDIQELIWMVVIADGLLIFVFTVTTYWAMRILSV